MSGKANLAASVAARLRNQARATGDDYQALLTAYCFERLLYRLGASPQRDRFVLKGAMLLRVWSNQPYRATRDLDFLRRGETSAEAIESDVRSIAGTPVVPDGVEFDGGRIGIEPIRADDEYVGVRAKLPARCDSARLVLQIDVGVGDAVWPAPVSCAYPTLLDFPAPDVLAYRRETVVAEKLDALIVLGDRNSRIKDFFDLHYLATQFDFEREVLVGAVQRTFARRHAKVPTAEPIGLTLAYWQNPSRPAQVRAFARRAGIAIPAAVDQEFARVLAAFLSPVLDDIRTGTRRQSTWLPGGPWR